MTLKFPFHNELTFPTWDAFFQEWKKINNFRIQENKKTQEKELNLIYRGQAYSEWKLKTTLERLKGKDKNNIDEYYKKIHRAKNEVEVFTKKTWNIPQSLPGSDFKNKLDLPLNHKNLLSTPADIAPYFLFLRHHGFPSPILDWTRSLYIAAYFAFNGQLDEKKYVSIYILLDGIDEKEKGKGAPTICTLGPSVKSPTRHFLQQCEYTYCLKQEATERSFVSHEKALSPKRRCGPYTWKCNISASERTKALCYFDSVNINAFSLYPSIESLMATTATRYFFIDEWNRKEIN